AGRQDAARRHPRVRRQHGHGRRRRAQARRRHHRVGAADHAGHAAAAHGDGAGAAIDAADHRDPRADGPVGAAGALGGADAQDARRSAGGADGALPRRREERRQAEGGLSNPRDKLFGRYRANALDRLRRVTLGLIELEAGRGDAVALEQIGRELHTLKGESRMFGQAAISEVVHSAETLVMRHDGSSPSPAVCARVVAGLDALSRYLRDELGGETQAAAVLAEVQRALTAGAAAAGAPAAGAPAADAPAAGAPAADAAPAAASAPAVGAPVADESVAAAPTPAGATPAADKDRWTQVSVRQVDELREQVAQFSVDFRALVARFRAAPAELSDAERRTLIEDLDRCRVQLDGVAGASWSLQLQSIEPTLGELVRHARELAIGQGKRVRGVVTAAGAQVERNVLDALWEPLLHIVRNAVDHGIELPAARGAKGPEATLTLRAEPTGATITIVIADDGAGVDVARVRQTAVARGMLTEQAAAALTEAQTLDLLFQHGFSTRSEVSDLSGRGIGLDVVRSVVEELGGTVALTSRAGEGTEIVLTIPARLSQ